MNLQLNTELQTISIRVKTMDQSEIKITDLHENDKVKNLKIKIEEKTQIPPDRQRLIYQGKQLKDDQEMLSDYNIKDDTVIHMVAKRQVD